ncbi:MAG TPA: malto-oligosyltrehalose synthase, partial [Longimicrobiaceae bacterium]|nr:malto-oligosyltrehalose synthase [Longimicrobiaceae bacterium]
MTRTDETAAGGAGPRIPRATYRLQFNLHFTFRDGEAVVPYLRRLGISDVYASPYLQARPGSLHGYDISDHTALNSEIGGEEEHARMAAAIRQAGMGHLLDVVPNHMGITGGHNRWWTDVLENGPSSPYAPFFDIDWEPIHPGLAGKVLLPLLGDAYGRVLERGELRLTYDGASFRVLYLDHEFPCSPVSVAGVIRDALGHLPPSADELDRMELESITDALANLPERLRHDPDSVARRRREWTVAQRRLRELFDRSRPVRAAVDAAVDGVNGIPGEPHSFDRLHQLLEEQSYRLANWRVAAEEINYRRFFDVNDLAGVRVERPEVFQETHRLVFRLLREGKVTGLRIDHPDGLYHPRNYLRQLQFEAAAAGVETPLYVLVEKILTGDEPLPAEWPVAGTVGYDWLNQVNGLFVPRAAEQAMDATYRRFTGMRHRLDDMVYHKKHLILRSALVSELTVLTTLLSRLSEQNRRYRDFTWGALRDGLRQVIACFPVYRTYIDAEAGAVSALDRQHVQRAVRLARRRNPYTSGETFDFIGQTLLLSWPDDLDAGGRAEHARFVMKFQQLTGPVMAKGVEDTTFYVFNRLVSLNEVGGEPGRFGVAPAEYHAYVARRAAEWPHAMNASSTHDTKRSEDVRARIDVLAELPEAWEAHVFRWAALNAGHKARSEDGPAIPDANDEYLLYQTLLGAWPLEEMDDDAYAAFVARIRAYMQKATREAKVHTSWINPDEEYDTALGAFVDAVLDRGGENAFLADFRRLQPIVARMGMVNALAQTLVKLASPGVPDVYQGQELWDFSLVDPDNRRPVDYALRTRMLDALETALADGDAADVAREMVEGWQDGRIKLFVTWRALLLRRALEPLFATGAYVPLAGDGERAEHLLAFARVADGAAVVVVVPRLVATLMHGESYALPHDGVWGDTRVTGGDDILAGRWRNVFTGEKIEAGDGGLA